MCVFSVMGHIKQSKENKDKGKSTIEGKNDMKLQFNTQKPCQKIIKLTNMGNFTSSISQQVT